MEITQENTPTSAESEVIFDYPKVRKSLDQLISDWKDPSPVGQGADALKGEEKLAEIRRELRRDYKDVPIMRARGELPADGNYIPQRIIDQQISQEKPNQIVFIEQPDRLLLFRDITNPEQPTEDLERAFNEYMRYPGWIQPWHRAFDAVDLHGGCCLEVKVDPSKPFYCTVEYIRREDLIFPVEATSIQDCEYIMRRYKMMPFELEQHQESYGFNPAAIKDLLAGSEDKRHQKVEVFKCYCKRDRIVYIFWYATKCQHNFLKDPEAYTLGIVDPSDAEVYLQNITFYQHAQAAVQEAAPIDSSEASQMQVIVNMPPPTPPPPLKMDSYPVFWLPYELIEDDLLLASKGLAFRHRADQEASSELWTSLINACNRASQVFSCYANNPQSQEGLPAGDKLVPGTIQQREVKWWNFPFPDPSMLMVAQAFGSNIAAASNSVDFAVNNRADTRKTAEEIKAARNLSVMQKSVGLSGQSLVILQVYELCWQIGRSFVLIGEIPTFPIPRERLLHQYVLAAAGDSDVLRRDYRKQVIRETFQYVVNSPIANQFLKYLINTFFPEQAKTWIPMLDAQDPAQLVQVALELLSNVPTDSLSEQQQLQLQQVLELFRNYLATRTGGVPSGTGAVAETSADTTPNNLPKSQGGAVSGASD